MFLKVVKLVVLFLLISLSAYSSDLFLLEINSQKELQTAEEIVGHAYRTIGGKFIVDLNSRQVKELNNFDIFPEFIAPGYSAEKYHLVRKIDYDAPRAPIVLSPVYSGGGAHIIEAEVGTEQILFQSGFRSMPIGTQQTPLFFRAADYDRIVILNNYPSDSLADLVNQDSLLSKVIRLQEFYTRFIGSDSAAIVNNWLRQQFRDLGYTNVYLRGFSAHSSWCGDYGGSNVICIKPGSENPDRYILVGGHKDTYRSQSCSNPNYYSPGADDNASGTSAVLELARIFRNFDNKKSIMFVAFGGEELGLHGSDAIAQTLYDDGADLELMVNLDMIGFTDDEVPDAVVNHFYAVPYRQLIQRSMEVVSQLIPDTTGGGSSDHQSFADRGFNTVMMHEGDFNWGGWHTGRDSYSRMDFPYLEKMVRALTASIAVFDQMPDPLEVTIRDKGDGQSVRISWDDGCDNCAYTAIYGMMPTFLDDTVDVPLFSTYYDIEGMVEGATYFIGVYQTVNGIPQLMFSLNEAFSQVLPRSPEGLIAAPDTTTVQLTWHANTELDISYYQIFKKTGENPWEMLADNYTDLSYLDTDVSGQYEYFYRLTAVDTDENVSDSSEIVSALLASFDAGILLVDETQAGGINPSEGAQTGFYRSMLGELEFSIITVNAPGDPLGHAILGQHNPVFWVDDDDFNHIWNEYEDTLQWYFDYGTDFLMAGWQSIYSVTGNTHFYPGDFLYDEIGITYVGMNILGRFVAANGEGDWPDLVVRSDAPNGGRLPNIQVFTPVERGEVIYRFETDPYHSGYQDKPVGVAYDTYNGKRVILGFPLYWLTPESAEALVTRVLEYFAAESIPPVGDVNGDWTVNILDVTYLINYLYMGGPEPPNLNDGDTNGDCNINILDITYFISFLYKNGPDPLEGCVI